MRLQIAILLFISSTLAFGSEEKAMDELFKKYDLLMDDKKVELVDEVFSQKFLRQNGGKEDYISKVKLMPAEKIKTKMKVDWRKSAKEGVFFAKVTPDVKSKKVPHGPEFIIVKEDGKLKIDGTLEDVD